MSRRSTQFFRNPRTTEFVIGALTAGLNTTDSDLDILDNSLSDGQNIIPRSRTSIKKRGGITLYGNFIGTTTGILGGFNYVNQAGTQDQLVVYDTVLKRYNSGNWDTVSGITFTTNKQADGAYFPFLDKFYIINNTDNVAKYTSSGSVDQSDSSFKKGKFIEHFQNRLLVANILGQENRVWYTDNQVDTFGANNWFEVDGKIIGIRTYFDKILIFTKRKIYRLANFTFDGTDSWARNLIDLPTEFGTIADRSIAVVNGYIYFLGQDVDGKCAIYVCDGYKTYPISDAKIEQTLAGLSASQLENDCAVADGNRYRVHVAESGQTTNNLGIVYDTVDKEFYPVERRLINDRADFSCLFTSETSGQWETYAGTQGTGQIYKLNDNDGLYDEIPEERYLTSGSYNAPVDANPAKRIAQSFKLSQYNAIQSINISKIALLLKKISGTTTDLQVRIETNNNGVPSGTLADAQATATISAFTDTSYIWKLVSFSNVTLLGNTLYWIVLQHITEGSGDSKYSWQADSCTPTYSNGNLATYIGAVASTQTYNPDGNPENTSVDGWVDRSDVTESFADIRSGSGNFSRDAGSVNYAGIFPWTGTDEWNELLRGIVLFDTSSLPDDAVITSATLSLYVHYKQNTFNQSVGVTAAAPASSTALVNSDYNIANFDSTRFASDVSIDSISVNSYNSFTLNAAGLAAISKTGISKFAIRLSCDIDNSAPTWSAPGSSEIRFHTSENTNKPRLTIAYTSATGSNVWASDQTSDANFIIYPQSAIDAYADSKAYLPNNGIDVQIHRFESIFSTIGSYNVEVGFTNSGLSSLTNYLINLAGNTGAKYDNSQTYDSGVKYDSQAEDRKYIWKEVDTFVGRTIKQRVRNRNANEQFEYNKTILIISKRLRNA